MRDSLPVNAGRRYFAAADVLRILCIFTVAWFHIWQQSWLDPSFRIAGHYFDLQRIVRRGYMLVDLTLLLTGFLLYRPLVRAEGKIADVKGFYYRRLCRILPCYLLAVLVAAAFALARGRAVGSAPLWRDLLTHLTFTHTFSMDTYYWTSLNAALWTVAVEMQFYLIFPLLARAFGKRPALTFSLMTLAALVSRALVALHAHELSLWLNQLPCMLDLYALGMLAAHLLEKRTDAPRRWVFFPLALRRVCRPLAAERGGGRGDQNGAASLAAAARRVRRGVSLFFRPHAGESGPRLWESPCPVFERHIL